MDSQDDLVHALARRDAAERLDALFRSADEAFFEIDVRRGTILWSTGVRLLLGRDPEHVGRGLRSWRALVHPDERPALDHEWRAILLPRSSVWSGDVRLARSDGSYASLRVRAFVMRAGDRPTWIVGTAGDVSAVRELEEEIDSVAAELGEGLARERRERIRAGLLLRAPTAEAVGEWDLTTDEISWSPNVRDVLGYPESELATMELLVRHAGTDEARRAGEEARRQAMEGGQSWSGSFGWLLPSGGRVTAEVHSQVMRGPSGRPERLIASVRTIPFTADASAAPAEARLTERQREVLRLVRLGRTNKEIAEELGVSEQGAKVLVSRLLRKFRVPNRAALAALARPPSE